MTAPDDPPFDSLPTADQSWLQPRAWKDLPTIADVEQWTGTLDHALQQQVTKSHSTGHGICFTLAAGGEIYLHTSGDGDVVLDVTPEAQWAAPVIAAATRSMPPRARLWVLPGDSLTQLILGLNSLIESSRLVVSHNFRASR